MKEEEPKVNKASDREGKADPEELEIGRSILDRIRREVNEEYRPLAEEDQDIFKTLYLTERELCVPDFLLGEDVMEDIISIYYFVFDGIREELEERLGTKEWISIYVQPSYQDVSFAVMATEEKVLLVVGRKPWGFWWESEAAMAEELESWYEAAARGLRAEPLVGKRTGEVIRGAIRELQIARANQESCLEHREEPFASEFEHVDWHIENAIAGLESLLEGRSPGGKEKDI